MEDEFDPTEYDDTDRPITEAMKAELENSQRWAEQEFAEYAQAVGWQAEPVQDDDGGTFEKLQQDMANYAAALADAPAYPGALDARE